MRSYVARRIRFRNGERHSVLMELGVLPVHEVTLYLRKFRTRGRAANTIHSVCCCLALLYRQLDAAGIDLRMRFAEGRFLSLPELERIAAVSQYRADDLNDEDASPEVRGNVTPIRKAKIGLRRSTPVQHIQDPIYRGFS
jgi:hypothetical protein